MVPVEPVSLTFGVVALASLFSTCVECFEYFNSAKDLEEDFEILLVKLDLEKTRLLIWGSAVGVLKAEGEGRIIELNDGQRVELIGRCLESMKNLLSDTDKLQRVYGLQSVTQSNANIGRGSNIISKNSMNLFKTSYRRFWARFAGDQARTTLASRTKWAIHDKARFEGLITHLKDLIDGLNQVLPVKREIQDQIIKDDIVSILSISKLRLVQSACEGSYTAWSDVASAVIEASEFGTVDRRNIEEWLGDSNALVAEESGKMTDALDGTESKKTDQVPLFETIPEFFGIWSRIYFVLTASCMNQQLGTPCQLANLGAQCAKNDGIIAGNPGSIGRRIAATLPPGNFTEVDLNMLAQKSEDDNAIQKTCLPVANIYVYCPPCACLISTALSICTYTGSHAETFFEFYVRPDDRLISSCCPNEDRSLGLTSLVRTIKDREATEWNATYLSSPFRRLDRQWMEQRLFEIEETEHVQSFESSCTLAGKLFNSHRSERTTAGIVILGELEYCLPIMQSAPFVPKPRIPRETEIFQMHNLYEDSEGKRVWNRTYLGTYTPKPIRGMSTSTTLRSSSSSTTITSAQSTLPAPRQTSPPPSPATKRQKTSPTPSVTTEDFYHEP